MHIVFISLLFSIMLGNVLYAMNEEKQQAHANREDAIKNQLERKEGRIKLIRGFFSKHDNKTGATIRGRFEDSEDTDIGGGPENYDDYFTKELLVWIKYNEPQNSDVRNNGGRCRNVGN